jgi:hypothetical protein
MAAMLTGATIMSYFMGAMSTVVATMNSANARMSRKRHAPTRVCCGRCLWCCRMPVSGARSRPGSAFGGTHWQTMWCSTLAALLHIPSSHVPQPPSMCIVDHLPIGLLPSPTLLTSYRSGPFTTSPYPPDPHHIALRPVAQDCNTPPNPHTRSPPAGKWWMTFWRTAKSPQTWPRASRATTTTSWRGRWVPQASSPHAPASRRQLTANFTNNSLQCDTPTNSHCLMLQW